MKLRVVMGTDLDRSESVVASLVAGSNASDAPEVFIGELRMSLEQVAQTYALLEATQEERRLLDGRAFPTLLAYFLRLYQEVERLDDRQLAGFLGCRIEDLARLGNFPEPRETPHFRTDVERMVTTIGCSQLRLVKVIRHAQVLDALRTAPPNQSILVHMMYRGGGCEWRLE